MEEREEREKRERDGREREERRDREKERERWERREKRNIERVFEKEIDKSIERCKDWDRKYTVNKSYKSFPDIKFLVNSNNYHKNKKITSKISEAG